MSLNLKSTLKKNRNGTAKTLCWKSYIVVMCGNYSFINSYIRIWSLIVSKKHSFLNNFQLTHTAKITIPKGIIDRKVYLRLNFK